jgi:hypothetical protein
MQGVGLRKDGLLVHESLGDGQLSEGVPALIRPAARAIDLRDGGERKTGNDVGEHRGVAPEPGDAWVRGTVAGSVAGKRVCSRGDVVGIAFTSSDLISPALKSAFELPRRAAAQGRAVFKRRE